MEKGILQSLLRLFYFVLVVVLAVATWVERANGSVFVRENIYGSGWFVVFCVLFFLLFLNYAIQKRVWKNCSSLLFSLSFALVSVGSVQTFAFSEKGYAHLQKGVSCTTFEMRSGAVRTFPFTLELDSFRVRYYPGTDAPMDYLTYMRADGECVEVSMNRNFTKGGYRFCQSSYDEEGEGGWLSVNYEDRKSVV